MTHASDHAKSCFVDGGNCGSRSGTGVVLDGSECSSTRNNSDVENQFPFRNLREPVHVNASELLMSTGSLSGSGALRGWAVVPTPPKGGRARAQARVSRSRARVWTSALRALLSVALVLGLVASARADENAAVAGVCFSPHGGCTALVVHELEQAKRQVRVLAYSFTSDAIADALVAAAKRGVDVQVVLDKSNRTGRYTDAPELDQAHVPVTIDAAHAIAHNKVIVIDGTTVLTGSFNFTVAAEAHNAENMLVLRSAELAAQYLANWELHRHHARPYLRRAR